jgi:hypothetical protein
MDKQFIMQRQGKDFVLYAGLLDAAHGRLLAISTQLLQAPTEGNGQVAIVHARVTLKDGEAFDGIGDASPANTSRNIAPHAIRMAETRAKARALRDALNIGGMSAVEELGDEEAPAPSPKAKADNYRFTLAYCEPCDEESRVKAMGTDHKTGERMEVWVCKNDKSHPKERAGLHH